MIYTKKEIISTVRTLHGLMRYMILAAQNGGDNNASNIMLKRGSSTDGQDFKESSWVDLTRGNACNGSMVLPEMENLLNHREQAVYRYDFEENGIIIRKFLVEQNELFGIQDQ